MPDVLIYCPLNPTIPGVDNRTLESIFAIEWNGKADIVFGKHDNATGRNQDITDKYNQARDLVLSNGYDALMTIEADMIPPPHSLERLFGVGVDVAYGLYVSRHGPHPWLVFSNVTENVRGSVQMGNTWDERESLWGNVTDTAGVGLGCTLIQREVLEAIPFRVADKWIANDWYFALDVAEKGFTQAHDCGVVCGHIDNYRVLWPDVAHGYRVTDEEEINIGELLNMANGKYIAMTVLDLGDRFAQPGEVITLDEEIAKVLLKKRFIKPAGREIVKEKVKYGSNN